MAWQEFLLQYKWTFIFYAAMIYAIYHFRHKFEWPARFIGLYKTQVGISLMKRLGKHQKFFRLFGDLAIVAGFAGMIFITGMLGKGLYDLFFVPEAPPVVAPVLPGITIPGVGLHVPLIIGWLALFIVIVIHEFSHGVVSKAYKIRVKSSGLMVFGPIGGAFVEPDEKVLEKRSRRTQLAIFSAGPFSNLFTSAIFYALLALILIPLLSTFIASNGVLFSTVQPGFPAAGAGVQPDIVYDSVNGVPVATLNDFYTALDGLAPGDEVKLVSSSTGEQHQFLAGEHPDDPERGYMGVVPGLNLKNPGLSWLYWLLSKLVELITWTFILGLGIGMANLLPIGPVDGGRMLKLAAEYFFGEKRGVLLWQKISMVMLIVIVVLLFVPIIKSFL